MEQAISQGHHTEREHRFTRRLREQGLRTLPRDRVTVLQINVGKVCNQACKHCHVEAGPKRTESMERPVMERLVELAAHPDIATVDITGGAPEMNPHFAELVERVAALGREVIVRCNLTIVEEPGFEWLPAFYARHGVHLVCSLPCYGPDNVKKQRGNGVFERSIAALRKLNAQGYGAGDGLRLDLVYNPVGPSLPPDQVGLEADYKRELGEHFGVRFDHLLTITNIPIGRFREALERGGELDGYLQRLDDAFNATTVPALMCRNTLSVGWDGRIYDCDFNQMLDMEIGEGGLFVTDSRFSLHALHDVPIRTGDHCLACTAGCGSSCGGALA